MVFTFPLDLEIARAQAHDLTHDFVRSFLESGAGLPEDVLWADYARIAALSQEVITEARKLGVLVATQATLADFRRVVRKRPVCTLFAHWAQLSDEGWVEFSDGGATCQELINELPRNYAGTLDLAICNSILCGQNIKRARPRSSVIMHRDESSIGPRVALYGELLRVLASEPTTYTGAWTRVNLAAMEMGNA